MTYLLLGAMLWFVGWKSPGVIPKAEIPLLKRLMDGYVSLPKWLYFLCGKPTDEILPEGVVATRAFMAQLTGILFIIYGLFDYSRHTTMSTNPSSYFWIIISGICLSYFLKRIRPFDK